MAVIVLAVGTFIIPINCLAELSWGNYGLAFVGFFIGLPLFWLGVLLYLVLIRLVLELYIILFDWIIETTKAARYYNENRS